MRIFAFYFSIAALIIGATIASTSNGQKWPKSGLDQLIDDSKTRACMEECRLEYEECIEEYQKWQCKMSLKRCVRSCLREEDMRNNGRIRVYKK